MWTYVKWTFRGALVLLVIAVLHYNLPQHDVVQITNTYNRQTTIGANWLFYARSDAPSTTGVEKRDIRFIEAVRPNGEVSVYRNEDTGWFWPPYLKYDSANLQAEASNAVSTKDTPQWVVITHYGWRTPIFSFFPNAIGLYPVAGPDVTVFPWISMILLVLLAIGAGMMWRMWRRFRQQVFGPAAVDPSHPVTAEIPPQL
ncbi:DUF1523 family protein [Rhodovulum euryhalinum]|uniref:Uncharacterized protein DUF1523 n=1 Tax=Rhodovulum euryhalinum TaxID=35805 RepID=A0A4R2KFI4_9RHOB|nr:DUF1523 family protein [Rhodovulum euryhalinum]TCO69119.1 uncharacterized protein DUF1523 [Rhodovulum euryhalinum]